MIRCSVPSRPGRGEGGTRTVQGNVQQYSSACRGHTSCGYRASYRSRPHSCRLRKPTNTAFGSVRMSDCVCTCASFCFVVMEPQSAWFCHCYLDNKMFVFSTDGGMAGEDLVGNLNQPDHAMKKEKEKKARTGMG